MTTSTFLEVVLRPSEDATYLGRDEIEDPLHEALVQAGIGEVVGGGTGTECSMIDVEVSDPVKGLALVREILIGLNVPRDTVINQYQPKKVVHKVYGSMTKEELLRIASEVLEGKRPESDLKKYGLTIGPTIEGEAAKDLLLNELDELYKQDAEKK